MTCVAQKRCCLSSLLGNLSSDDGDVKKNGEKNNRSRLAKPQLCTYITRFCTFRGPRDDAVVRALTSHQCGPGSNPGVDAICGLSLLLVLSFAPRGFSPGTPVFPSPQKTAFSNSNSTRNQVDKEPLCGCATSKSLFIYLFIIHLLTAEHFTGSKMAKWMHFRRTLRAPI